MATRKMTNSFEGFQFYSSSFDQETGTLVRSVEVADPMPQYYGHSGLVSHIARKLYPGSRYYNERHAMVERWEERYDRGRREAFSPSPETLDISITDWCNFGCSYCYQSSEQKLRHAPKTHVIDVLKQFTHVPYQVAIGGGEPTAHPDFPWILYSAREMGAVPNFTTAGHIWRDEVLEAANAACGGVSLTYHAFKGLDYFKETYKRWRNALRRPQLNVHIIADRDVANSLGDLARLEPETGKLSVILLAYYPDVGRSTLANIMPKSVFNEKLPSAIRRFLDGGHKLAFSEGLLPYFLSRPDLGVDTRFASRAEGLFSAYVDPMGDIYASSFSAPSPGEREEYREHHGKPRGWRNDDGSYTYALHGMKLRVAKEGDPVPEVTLQQRWEQIFEWRDAGPNHNNCDRCAKADRCATPSIHHYLACAHAENNDNNPPLSEYAKLEMEEYALYHEYFSTEKKDHTEAEKAAFDQASLEIRRKKWKIQGLDENGCDPADNDED